MLKIEDVAKKLNVSQKSVRRYIHSKKLKSRKIGGVHRIDVDDLNIFLQRSLIDNQSQKAIKNKSSKSTKNDHINWIDISDDWEFPTQTNLTSADLFCGAGGMAKGFENAGFKQICGLDWFKEAGMTYRNNFNHPLIEGDIKDEEVKQNFISTVNKTLKGKKLNVLSGGFPCQGFSMSGNRIVEDPRNSLYKEMIEIIDRLNPDYVVAENVKGLDHYIMEKLKKKF